MAPLLGGLLLLAACTPAPGAQGSLDATQWELTAIGGRQVAGEPGGRQVTIRFENGTASGSAGCNSYGGQFHADPGAGTLAFSQILSTLMACPEGEVMQVEAAFLGALNAADRYEIAGDSLRIFAGDQTLVFHRVPFTN